MILLPPYKQEIDFRTVSIWISGEQIGSRYENVFYLAEMGQIISQASIWLSRLNCIFYHTEQFG